MDPVKRAEFEEQMAKVVAEYRKRETKDMTKAEILTAVTLLEEAKFKAQQKKKQINSWNQFRLEE